MSLDVAATELDTIGFRLLSGEYALTFEAGQLRLTRSGSSAGLRFATLGAGGLDALAHIYQRQIGSVSGRPLVILNGGHEWATFALSFDVDPARPGLFHWRFLVTPHAPPPASLVCPELIFDGGHQVTVYTQSAPMAAGLVYVHEASLLDSTLFYFQDLTELNSYFAASHTHPMRGGFPIPHPHFAAGSGIVGYKDGQLGLELPGEGLAVLPLGKPTVISDSYLALTPDRPVDEPAAATRFLTDLAPIYGRITRPKTELVDWQDLARRTLADLPDPRNWVEIDGKPFLRAYVNDERSTAELITQLDVLTSLCDYQNHYGRESFSLNLDTHLGATLPHFYSPEAQAMLNQPLAGRGKADSWYFLTALTDLSRLARGGDGTARKLLLDSVERAIEAAHCFEYVFPIFFDPTGQRELPPPGTPFHPPEQYDAAGAYAYLMLDLFEDSGEERYLEEAQAAVGALLGHGFDLAYELHVTALAATACARLFRLTGRRSYLDLSFVPLAAFLRHCWLWECEYGYAAHYRTFFGLSPMTFAAVITAKEQYEAWQYLAGYLQLVHGEVPAAVEALVAEYCRHTLNTMRSAFAPLMPPESVVEKPQIARTVPHNALELYIPLEDIAGGWRQSGNIAQELYGAGMALSFAAQAYVPLRPGLIVYSEYPLVRWQADSFTLSGTPDFEVNVALLGNVKRVTDADGREFPHTLTEDGIRFRARGGTTVCII